MERQMTLTCEAVSDGHPDKLADQMADAAVDLALGQDPHAHAACEVLLTRDLLVLAGEFSGDLEMEGLGYEAREAALRVLADAGYRATLWGFDVPGLKVDPRLFHQSPEIAGAVRRADDQLGAGDQGTVYGFAAGETPEFLPYPLALSRRLMMAHSDLRRFGKVPWLGPDAKAQATGVYEDGRFLGIRDLCLSTVHAAYVEIEEVRAVLRQLLVDRFVPEELRLPDFEVALNPAGAWTVGGPAADTGLTGRKIIADTYGGAAPHGGGAFSGKDGTKVDRSGALAARYIAVNVVAAGLASRCIVKLSYWIGRPDPVAFSVDTRGTGTCPDERIAQAALALFPVTPAAILDELDLRRPIWRQTAAFGPFGHPGGDLPWERPDRAEALRRAL